MTVSPQDCPQWLPPSSMHALVWASPVVYQAWFPRVTKHDRGDDISFPRLSHQRLPLLSWVHSCSLSLSLSLTSSGRIQLPRLEGTQAVLHIGTHSKDLSSPASSHVNDLGSRFSTSDDDIPSWPLTYNFMTDPKPEPPAKPLLDSWPSEMCIKTLLLF